MASVVATAEDTARPLGLPLLSNQAGGVCSEQSAGLKSKRTESHFQLYNRLLQFGMLAKPLSKRLQELACIGDVLGSVR